MLVRVDQDVWRPMMVAAVELLAIHPRDTPTLEPSDRPDREWRISGTIFATPEDHVRPAFRGASDRAGDPARISGRPDRSFPFAYGEYLSAGMGLGQWRTR